MPQEKVKLPRSSYEELCKIIKAYGGLAEPASLDHVSSISAVGKTVISANNAFLVNLGIIQGGKTKMPTKKGTDLANALQYEMPDEIRRNWGTVVHENEFLNKMALAVKIRKSMETSALVSHIAYSAGEAKSSSVLTGARTVIDILRAAEVVREENGQIVAGLAIGERPKERAGSVSQDQMECQSKTSESAHQPQKPTAGALAFAIQLRINARPEELEGLGPKIRALLRDLGDLPEDTIERIDSEE